MQETECEEYNISSDGTDDAFLPHLPFPASRKCQGRGLLLR